MNLVRSKDALADVVRHARTLAVVGMKDDTKAGEPAVYVPQALQRHGMRVIPVNPTIAQSLGEKAYASLAEVPDAFDVVLVFRRSDRVGELADEVLALQNRPRVVWMQTGIANAAAAQKLADAGILVVQNECMMVVANRYL